MALTSSDETDLLLPLLGAMRETPRFSTFLERLRRRTGARYIALLTRQGDLGKAPITEFHAGDPLPTGSPVTGSSALFDLDRAHYDSLRPGRVYALGELVDHDPVLRAQRWRELRDLGLADERIVRILADPGLDAWLVLARTSPCSASDSALLSNLAPYVAEALRSGRDLDAARDSARINAAGMARSGNGWMTFDADGRLVDLSAQTQTWWSAAYGQPPRRGERLLGLARPAERGLLSAIDELARDKAAAPRPVLLSDSPRVEALVQRIALDDDPPPATTARFLAVFALPHAPSDDAQARLTALHALPPREAELALKLSEGLSIAEAAQAMGLTVETARNYSKRIYAKLGVRGKAELVRRILEGTAHMT
ncbi:helix-turn-helix transcriptional regulator [Novosphingobium decolorationis]|uniref:Helix-turn-helix transcriptional regulator n=1 Tax=Novosphingobium decolorationis TaxID=2698673 RepID=A0ABX8E1X7_9SPHN|nr:helix-turn-helix transcriptional regulator [Novosphingobium decolorationis]QVM82918.1 helix-turn-helix transcriptional regulator [Novosphingobium decolorationis]